ncbi:substrate-binding periplasmic protein [Chromobacterium haemolyticum]|uniref:substrate-binding periplasmic protein n=1 Tax=Chromobacterium TaxID=535 RepID=UPI0040563473
MRLQFFYMLPFTIMLFTKAHAAEVSIGMVDFCPYMCVGTANKGFIVEIVEQAFKKNGIAAKFTVKPWARAVADTRVGKLDGLLAPGKNEAPGLMFPETPVAVQQNCFYAKSTSQWNYRSFNDVKNGTFISYIGFGNRLDLEKSIGVGAYKKNFLEFNYDNNYMSRAASMVNANRAIAMWADPISFEKTKQDGNKLLNGLKNKGCISSYYLYLAFPPTSVRRIPELVNLFEDGISKLKRSGELKAIYKKYHVSNLAYQKEQVFH